MKTLLWSFFSLLLAVMPARAQQNPSGQDVASPEDREVRAVINGFYTSIIENDRDKATELLSEGAQILEGGNIETKEEYLSHHFHADGKFLGLMKRTIESRTIRVDGNVAWISTRTHLEGDYDDRNTELNSLELAVLNKEKGNWKIAALHWSSASRD